MAVSSLLILFLVQLVLWWFFCCLDRHVCVGSRHCCYSLSCSWGQKLSNYTFGQELSANSSMQQVANWWKPCKERISNELAELLTSWSGNMLKIHLARPRFRSSDLKIFFGHEFYDNSTWFIGNLHLWSNFVNLFWFGESLFHHFATAVNLVKPKYVQKSCKQPTGKHAKSPLVQKNSFKNISLQIIANPLLVPSPLLCRCQFDNLVSVVKQKQAIVLLRLAQLLTQGLGRQKVI